MGWVVDSSVQSTSDLAADRLKRVAALSSSVLIRIQDVESGTRLAIGNGHSEGDRITRDAMHAIDCLQRVQSAVHAASSELARVRIMMWERERD